MFSRGARHHSPGLYPNTAMDLTKVDTATLMTELQRRVRCSTVPERRAVLIGACRRRQGARVRPRARSAARPIPPCPRAVF